jgi:methionyl-tRNA synthetase
MRTVLAVATQLVSDANTLLSPFLPHSAQRVHEAIGGTGEIAPMPTMVDVDDLDLEGRRYPTIQGDYSSQHGTWARRPIAVGAVVPAPTPVFTKLDDEIVEAELERMASE